ncbi:MAG: hypothetical protein HYX69_05235 [Planctomycetia bacterium]|nr:hypothetical protein [Planctomycetia bacterium]
MNGSIVRVVVFCVLAVSSALPCRAEKWKDAKVMPKSATVQLRKSPGDRAGGATVFQMEWPAEVKKVDGQWLQIADPGSYSREPIEAWVRKEKDVVALDDIQKHCTDKIREYEAKNANGGKTKTNSKGKAADNPWDLYWLRGIYWESKDETENAIADYQRARQHNCQVGDVHHRLGRMWAKRATQFKANDMASFDQAFASFRKAEETFQQQKSHPVPPQLYDSWGDAFADQYDAGEADARNLVCCACEKYRDAERANPSWSVPPYKQGKLLIGAMDKGKTPEAAETTADRRILLVAIQRFDQAIRLDPNFRDAYRDRADALRRLVAAPVVAAAARNPGLAKSCDGDANNRPPVRPDPPIKRDKRDEPDKAALAVLDQALRSDDRAIDLGYNREPKSLEVKAKIAAAVAKQLYPKTNETPKHAEESRAREAYRLLVRAESFANDAANYSEGFEDSAGRLQLAFDYHTDAYLRAKHVPDIRAFMANAAVQIAEINNGMSRLVKEADDKRRSELNSIQNAVQEAYESALVDTQTPTHAHETVRKLHVAEQALSHGRKAIGGRAYQFIDPAAKFVKQARDARTSLEAALQSAAPPPPPPPPTYVPLYRSATPSRY